ncbi:hypothetical protein [Echinicola arenosa]|nr:hypothetical protein [Echinicola arenosa]
MMKQTFFLLLLVLILASCAGSGKMSKSAAAYNNYSEDLSYTRVTFPDLPEANQLEPVKNSGPVSSDAGDPVDADLAIALDNFAQKNADREVYNGFTILVYSGIDRDEAFKTRNQLYNTLPTQIKAEMEYEQPRYLVKVGQYINRIEAQSLFHTIKKDFPGARIIQERFGKETEEDEEIEAEVGTN